MLCDWPKSCTPSDPNCKLKLDKLRLDDNGKSDNGNDTGKKYTIKASTWTTGIQNCKHTEKQYAWDEATRLCLSCRRCRLYESYDTSQSNQVSEPFYYTTEDNTHHSETSVHDEHKGTTRGQEKGVQALGDSIHPIRSTDPVFHVHGIGFSDGPKLLTECGCSFTGFEDGQKSRQLIFRAK